MTIRSSSHSLLRGIIFDLGGTLLRPGDVEGIERANASSLGDWARWVGLPVPGDAISALHRARTWQWEETLATGRQITTRELVLRYAPTLGWALDERLLADAVRAFFAPEVAAAEPYPDAREVVTALHALDLRLAVISNASDHALVEELLIRIGLRAFFDPVVSSAAFGRIKPDPGIFHVVLDAWGLPAEACVMVGDSLYADVVGGKRLGMRTIHVTMEAGTRGARRIYLDANPSNVRLPADEPPEATVASLTEVVTIVRRWLAEGETS